jgi:hypothetical protein
MVIKRIESFVTWLAPVRRMLVEEVAAMVACAFSTGAVFDIPGAPDPQLKEQFFPSVHEYCHSNATSDPLG